MLHTQVSVETDSLFKRKGNYATPRNESRVTDAILYDDQR